MPTGRYYADENAYEKDTGSGSVNRGADTDYRCDPLWSPYRYRRCRAVQFSPTYGSPERLSENAGAAFQA